MAPQDPKPCGCSGLAELARRVLAAIGGDLLLNESDVQRLRTLAGESGRSPGFVRVTYKHPDRASEVHPVNAWTPSEGDALDVAKVELL